ncbi:hypothetical protein ASF10_15950 [Flavobacterium sp. Leaf82]|uniref:MBG domain-containing protein n=1 Tax=Flavobacterium sp. Leaf82 TaxID=1736238 RepID=UPI000712CB14|nr:MBG domain-containing protein [Flavobacterium sp. Leaf82]KQO20569.1 hypothetical protein ASF10_15950 [Flavobacterium sp. Leaf82]
MIYTSTLRFTRMSLLFFWIAFLSIQYSAAQAPTVQASEIDFNNTTTTSTTVSWTNGDGASRVVFIRSGLSGIPVPVNNTTYGANAVFGLGTEIGSTGWYCIYNGTGTSVDLTGLTEATTYQVMTLEYNGAAPGDEIYHFSVSTGNPSQIATNTTSGSTVGPGGAIAGLQLWLDATNGMTASGGNLTAWTDQAGINNFTVSATPPTVNDNALNFHPTVAFNNTNAVTTYPATQNLIGTTSVTYVDAYGVFKVSGGNGGTVIGGTVNGAYYGKAVFTESGSRMYIGNGTQSYFSSFGYTDYTNFHVFQMDRNTSTTTTARLDATNQAITNQSGGFSSISMIPAIGTTNNNGASNGWRHLNGQIAELIMYNQSTAAQRINIESYLALKYGIHKIDNYVDGANTMVWDATANAAFHNDVFGIGIDDVSGLNQVISNSMNTGGGDGTGQTGKGNIVISTPSSLVNNDFLIIGHNTSALTETIVTVSSTLTVKRIQRNWKVQATGTPGSVTLSYDITGLDYSGQSFSDYILLVDPTGTGNFDGGSVVKYPAVSLTGNKLTFNTVLLPTGSVFTFQTLANPTVQATNVVYAATTGTTTTVSWTNGNGASRAVFMYAGASGNPVPLDDTSYTPNTVFGTGTQIGSTGWYCVYNGTGTTVNVTGLLPATTYQIMVVEYNGSAVKELYQTAVSTANPAGVTTLNNVATLSNLTINEGSLIPVFASGTTNYTATVNNTITSLTVTPTTTDANATVTVNGTAVLSGSPSGAIALAVGLNVITTIVTAQDGTTLETYTITITRTEPVIVTTGTLSALTTIYGTPSASGTFNVSGTDMLEGILVTAPSGFEVSSDNITFTDATITVGAVGIIVSTPVYIRLKATIPAGSYLGDIVLSSAAAATVNFATVSSTVNKAILTVATDVKTKIYGSVNPTLTASYTGFVNGDTVANLTTPATISTIADTTSSVGLYAITASGATSDNYTFNYVDANLTITPANLAITATNQTKTYGSANPTFTFNYVGFVNGETAAVLLTPAIVTTTADASSPVGVYPLTVSGATATNYSIGYTTGATLTIIPANLTLTVDAQTKTYGSTNPTLTASYTGFVNGDNEASLTTPATISTIADATSPVGTYPITTSGAINPNYTIAYVDGTLTVTAATLTITADVQSKTYGSANPTLTASYTGFVNGDTVASLTTPPTIATIADATSPVGTYPITASGAVNTNYTIAYTDGILTVNPATLTVTADAQSKTYGSANPTLTATYTGFVNGDTAASLTTPPTIATIADATSPVGTYPITASGAVNPNYTIAYVDGTLTVTAATLTITADAQSKTYGSTNPTLTASYSGFVNGDTAASLTDAQSKTYGSTNPTLTASYSGFVNGDTAASLTTLPTIATIADVTSPVGTYPITASGATSSNYTISYVDGTLTVTAATLTITADAQSKTYGSTNPTLTASYTGFVNGDTVATLTTPPTIATTAVLGSPVGTYPITASGAVNSNYTIRRTKQNIRFYKSNFNSKL